MNKYIFKVCDADEWAAAQCSGAYEGAPVDLQDGFIHCSTAEQLAETAAKHFARKDNIILAAIDCSELGEALRWEPSRGGVLFPHLYEALDMRHVVWSRPLPLADGIYQLPELDQE